MKKFVADKHVVYNYLKIDDLKPIQPTTLYTRFQKYRFKKN